MSKRNRSKRPRLRMLMQAFLTKRGISPHGLTYGRLKEAVLGELGFDVVNAPRNKALREFLCPAPKVQKVSFYETDEWRELRYRALKLHGGCCQCCGNRPTRGNPLHVDHIKPRSKYPELALSLSNLQVLCADCNLGKRAWDETDWRPKLEAVG